MKVFGVSVVTIVALVVVYFIGVRFSGPGQRVLSAVGL